MWRSSTARVLTNASCNQVLSSTGCSVFTLGHARTLLSSSQHTLVGRLGKKKLRILNLHQAYNIRVGLFVESRVGDPSRQARPRKQEKEGERRTGSDKHSQG